MLVLKALLVFLCILLLAVSAILFIPFGYRAEAVGLDEKRIRFKVFWLFQMLSFSGSYRYKQGFESRVSFLGFSFRTGGSGKPKEEKEKRKKEGKKRRSFSTEAVRQMLTGIRKVIAHLMPDRLEGYGRIGFDDPYHTGLLCSVVESLRGTGIHDVRLDYVFDDEVYEGEVYVKGRIYIVYIVYIAARLLLNRSARELLIN